MVKVLILSTSIKGHYRAGRPWLGAEGKKDAEPVDLEDFNHDQLEELKEDSRLVISIVDDDGNITGDWRESLENQEEVNPEKAEDPPQELASEKQEEGSPSETTEPSQKAAPKKRAVKKRPAEQAGEEKTPDTTEN